MTEGSKKEVEGLGQRDGREPRRDGKRNEGGMMLEEWRERQRGRSLKGERGRRP